MLKISWGGNEQEETEATEAGGQVTGHWLDVGRINAECGFRIAECRRRGEQKEAKVTKTRGGQIGGNYQRALGAATSVACAVEGLNRREQPADPMHSI
jgi:hypothetical protein